MLLRAGDAFLNGVARGTAGHRRIGPLPGRRTAVAVRRSAASVASKSGGGDDAAYRQLYEYRRQMQEKTKRHYQIIAAQGCEEMAEELERRYPERFHFHLCRCRLVASAAGCWPHSG